MALEHITVTARRFKYSDWRPGFKAITLDSSIYTPGFKGGEIGYKPPIMEEVKVVAKRLPAAGRAARLFSPYGIIAAGIQYLWGEHGPQIAEFVLTKMAKYGVFLDAIGLVVTAEAQIETATEDGALTWQEDGTYNYEPVGLPVPVKISDELSISAIAEPGKITIPMEFRHPVPGTDTITRPGTTTKPGRKSGAGAYTGIDDRGAGYWGPQKNWKSPDPNRPKPIPWVDDQTFREYVPDQGTWIEFNTPQMLPKLKPTWVTRHSGDVWVVEDIPWEQPKTITQYDYGRYARNRTYEYEKTSRKALERVLTGQDVHTTLLEATSEQMAATPQQLPDVKLQVSPKLQRARNGRVEAAVLEFEIVQVRRSRRKLPRSNRRMKDQKSRHNRDYIALLNFINKTYGVVSEVIDFYEVFSKNIYVNLDGKVKTLDDFSFKQQANIVYMMATGEIPVESWYLDVRQAQLDLISENATDRAIGGWKKYEKDAFREVLDEFNLTQLPSTVANKINSLSGG